MANKGEGKAIVAHIPGCLLDLIFNDSLFLSDRRLGTKFGLIIIYVGSRYTFIVFYWSIFVSPIPNQPTEIHEFLGMMGVAQLAAVALPLHYTSRIRGTIPNQGRVRSIT